MRWCLVVGVLGACSLNSGVSGTPPGDGGVQIDGAAQIDATATDADVSGGDGATELDAMALDAAVTFDCNDWGTPTFFEGCNVPEPSSGTMFLDATGTYVYNTSSRTLAAPGGGPAIVHDALLDNTLNPPAVIVSAENFRLGPNARLRVEGANPLILASWSAMDVQGEIDVASLRGQTPGAGSGIGTCSAAVVGADGDDGDGGGGGGLGSAGGDGGGGSAGGDAQDVNSVLSVRGGCPGAAGGSDGGVGGPGVGGPGGGGIALASIGSLTISGRVHVGGGGGSAGGPHDGGGGGGSGGLIVLIAPTVTTVAGSFLAANGGGGGEGGGDSRVGGFGDDAKQTDAVAPGGATSNNGGDGGAGGFANTGPGIGLEGNTSGGGGGGAVGYILVKSPAAPTLGGTETPPAQVVP